MNKPETFLQIILASIFLVSCTPSVEDLKSKVDSLQNKLSQKERIINSYETKLFELGVNVSHKIENDSLVILEIIEDDEIGNEGLSIMGKYMINSWGTIKNGQEILANCNVCPEIEFSNRALLSLIKPDKTIEKHSWRLINDMLTIQMVEPSENVIVKKSMYFVQSTGKNTIQLTSKGNDFIVNMTLME